jgi:hypothetical protein
VAPRRLETTVGCAAATPSLGRSPSDADRNIPTVPDGRGRKRVRGEADPAAGKPARPAEAPEPGRAGAGDRRLRARRGDHQPNNGKLLRDGRSELPKFPAEEGPRPKGVASRCGDRVARCGDRVARCGDRVARCGDRVARCGDRVARCRDRVARCREGAARRGGAAARVAGARVPREAREGCVRREEGGDARNSSPRVPQLSAGGVRRCERSSVTGRALKRYRPTGCSTSKPANSPPPRAQRVPSSARATVSKRQPAIVIQTWSALE